MRINVGSRDGKGRLSTDSYDGLEQVGSQLGSRVAVIISPGTRAPSCRRLGSVKATAARNGNRVALCLGVRLVEVVDVKIGELNNVENLA